jgi:enterochelin esterase-like enzyme
MTPNSRARTPRFPAVLAGLLVLSLPLHAGGRLVDLTVPGPSLEGKLLGTATERDVAVYLPPGYEGEAERRYPSLYLLHGVLDQHTVWTRPWSREHPGFATIQDLMDAGIESGLLREMIIVIPDADKTAHFTDSPVRGNWGSFIAHDLVAFVDARFRTLADTAARGIAGHSMGGHGAIKLGMRHPDVFSVVYGMNPSLLGWGGDVSPDNPELAEAFALDGLEGLEGLEQAGFYAQALAAVAHAFSPNPEAKLLADLPFRPGSGHDEGSIVPASPGYERWQAQMPVYMAASHLDALRRLRGLRFDSAFVDEYSHIPPTSREFSRVLTELGIRHTFEMYNGDHRNRLWGRQGRLCTEVLPWFSRLLEPAVRQSARD